MIEIEKKFIPTFENLEALLDGAVSMGEMTNHDIYYDYPDYRFLKGNIAFRNRNGNFELKLKQSGGVHVELEDAKEIESYFNVTDLEKFIEENLKIAMEFKVYRKKYKKEDFNLDIDETDFGYKVGEIELMVEKEEDVKNAEEKIEQFASKYNLELKKGLSKKKAYLKKFNIEL